MKCVHGLALLAVVVLAISFTDAQMMAKKIKNPPLIQYLHISDPKNFENIQWWHQCRPLCQNYIKFCFSKWMDPRNLFYPHCEDHMTYYKPSMQCQECLRVNGYPSLEPKTTTTTTTTTTRPTTTTQMFTAPLGTSRPSSVVCKCKRIQTLTTVTVGSKCSALANQGGACELSHPSARTTTSDESKCGCEQELNGKMDEYVPSEFYEDDYNSNDYHAVM